MRRINIQEFIGKKFNRLTIISESPNKKHGRIICQCECGDIKEYGFQDVKKNHSKSCGCILSQYCVDKNTTHGLCGHPIYRLYSSLLRRCYNKNSSGYYKYGARGVTMCDEWKSNFMSFYNWALSNGWQKGLHLDKDKLAPNQVGMIYNPEFCCFITHQENMWYKRSSIRVEYNNEIKTLSEWVYLLKLNSKAVYSRIANLGWTSKDAFELPITIRKNVTSIKTQIQ